ANLYDTPSGKTNLSFNPEIIGYNDYYPFGMLVPNRHGQADSYRYGFGGKELDNELKGEGNSIDYGARMYDPRIGRWFAPDPLEKKYPYSTTYGFALNTPIQAVDREGKDVIIIIWATANGEIGHAAIAVSNYKKVINTYKPAPGAAGPVGYVEEYVPDGTYTYYDNWPSNGVNLSGIKGAMKTVTAYRSKDLGEDGIIIKDISEFTSGNLTKIHPLKPILDASGNPVLDSNGEPTYTGIPNEKHMQDGVLLIKTDFGIDEKLKKKLVDLNKKETDYNGKDFNCSTYVSCGLETFLGEDLGEETLKIIFSAVTPNKLYRDAKKAAQDKGFKTTELKSPGAKVNNDYQEGLEGSPGRTTPTDVKN
ncbi:RHS repeat domain-containing protein, partial [Tenacibaculum maritimum]